MLSPHFSVLGWLLPSSMRIEFELSWSRLCRQNQERKNHLRGPSPVDDVKRYTVAGRFALCSRFNIVMARETFAWYTYFTD